MRIYLASPYTHDDPEIERERFVKACETAGKLIQAGHIVYCPIAHSHPIKEATADLPGTWEFWKPIDDFFIGKMEALVILILPGWAQSKGVQGEIMIARPLGKQIGYIAYGETNIMWERHCAEARA
jgi:hypothetical protein